MKIAVEVSMYPLSENYGDYILEFINRLKNYPSMLIKTNAMSTQIIGPYDELMEMLTIEMKRAFQEKETIVLVTKFLNVDLTEELAKWAKLG